MFRPELSTEDPPLPFLPSCSPSRDAGPSGVVELQRAPSMIMYLLQNHQHGTLQGCDLFSAGHGTADGEIGVYAYGSCTSALKV